VRPGAIRQPPLLRSILEGLHRQTSRYPLEMWLASHHDSDFICWDACVRSCYHGSTTPQAQMRHTIRTRTSGAVTCIGFVSAMWCLRIMAFPFVCAASLTYQGTSDTHTAACKNRDLLSSGVPKHITGISRFRPRPSLSAHLLAMSDVDSSERNEQPCDLLPSARHSASTNCDTSCELQNTNWSGEMLTVHVDFAFFDNLSHHLTTMLVIPFPSRQIPRVWNLFIYYGTFGYWKYRAPTPLSLLPYLLSPGCHATALCQVEESVKSVDSVKAFSYELSSLILYAGLPRIASFDYG
jgi:hypothetical protein